ncbi:MAG: hypothetical protein WDW19_04540 [Neisseriaceae bacterium]
MLLQLKKTRKKPTKSSAKRRTVVRNQSGAEEEPNKLYIPVKYEQKNQFKTLFPEAIWQKGKGWAVDDTFSNQNKLEEWYKKSKELEGQELQQALNQLKEAFTTIVKKIEELDILVSRKNS